MNKPTDWVRVRVDATEVSQADGAETTYYAGWMDILIGDDDLQKERHRLDGETDRGFNTPEDRLMGMILAFVGLKLEDELSVMLLHRAFRPFLQMLDFCHAAIGPGGKTDHMFRFVPDPDGYGMDSVKAEWRLSPGEAGVKANAMVVEARSMLQLASQVDFGDDYCDAESMLILNNVINDLEMVCFDGADDQESDGSGGQS